nr:8059_t:CDS:2 [Entrophospora candida]
MDIPQQGPKQAFQPIFTNASSLISQKVSKISISTLPVGSIPQTIVANTEKSTRNWVTKFEEFRKNYNYIIPVDKITNSELIEQQVCEYIAQMTKKNNSGEYKANIVKQAVGAINHHLVKFSPIRGINLYDKYEFPDLWTVLHCKMKDLQEKGFEYYNLRVDQFQPLPDGGLLFQNYRSKNNQRGIEGVTGHKSTQGIRVSKEVNEKQHLASTNNLIHVLEPSRSIHDDSTLINNSLNTVNTTPEFSSGTQFYM